MGGRVGVGTGGTGFGLVFSVLFIVVEVVVTVGVGMVGVEFAVTVADTLVLFDGLARHDARGDGDDGVAEEHDDGGDELASAGDRGNVAVADGGDGDNSPVDAAWDAGDGWVGGALDAVHGGAENHGNDEDEHHKDKHLHGTATERVQQEPRLAEEPLHLEYAEDAEHTHETEYGEGAGGGYQQTEPGGEYREEVDDAIEGEHIFPRFVEAVDAQIVLEGKEDGEEPADGTHGPGEPGGGARHALHHDGDDVDADENQQPDVELFSCRGVGFEDDGVDLLFGQRSVAFGK